jgi:type I restriction enzyme, S subunit
MIYRLEECIQEIIDNRGRNPEDYVEFSRHPIIDNFLIKSTIYPDLTAVKRYIDDDTYENFIRNKSKEKDVLITLVGNGIGNVTLLPEDNAEIIQNTIGLRANPKIITNEFLYYCLRNDFENIIKLNRGTSQPSIKKGDLLKLTLDIPSLVKQSKILNVLWNMDNKIHLNNLIIKNLEQLSQTLFKRWFIDFEFPNEEGLPYQSSGGNMLDSEFGEIPVGWKVDYLASSTEFLSGGTPKTKESTYWNGDIPFFTPKDVGSSAYTTNTEKTITELGLSKCNSRLYSKNTVFITARGTVGKVALANRDMAMNQSCFALKNKADNQFYLYGAIRALLREIIQGANGAVFSAINLSDLNRLRLAVPQQELIDKYESIAATLFNQMSELEFENINLQSLRDSLLPKLLSGEIEIPDESVVK